jgi:hypothetical protein
VFAELRRENQLAPRNRRGDAAALLDLSYAPFEENSRASFPAKATAMTRMSHFERLAESVELIARHCDYPGKREVVEQCAEEIGELLQAGKITDSQEEYLQEILRGGRCRRQPA